METRGSKFEDQKVSRKKFTCDTYRKEPNRSPPDNKIIFDSQSANMQHSACKIRI